MGRYTGLLRRQLRGPAAPDVLLKGDALSGSDAGVQPGFGAQLDDGLETQHSVSLVHRLEQLGDGMLSMPN
jgi:hypothetical protein